MGEFEFQFNPVFEQMVKDYQIREVVLLGHLNPDGDASGCVMSIAHYIHTVYPELKVMPYLADNLDKGPAKMVKEDLLFTPFAKPLPVEPYLAIVCDTSTRQRIIGRDLYENAVCSLVMDHHISNEGYGTCNHTQDSEACSENVFFALDWDRWEEKKEQRDAEYPNAADYCYLGIVHDTTVFTRTDALTFDAASKLISLGVEHDRVMKTMQNDNIQSLKRRAKIFEKIESFEDGLAGFVYMPRSFTLKYGITYEDVHAISSILRDCEELKIGFTFFEEEDDFWRCSFRSDGDWMDVNQLVAGYGGGGHRAASGLRIQTKEPEKLLEEIKEMIHNRRRDVPLS